MRATSDLTKHLEGALDTRISPGDLVRHPLVVHSWPRLVEIDLRDPVRARPAASRATLDTHGPWIFATAGDLIRERHQLVPGLGNLVTVRLKLFRTVPDCAFVRRLVEDSVEVTVIGSQVSPGARVIAVDFRHIQEAV